MSRLEKVMYALNSWEEAPETHGFLYALHPRIKLLVTLCFIGTVLSVPLREPWGLPLYFLYPIVTNLQGGRSFQRLWMRSLPVLPLLLCIGIPNLFYPEGWTLVCSLILRGLLCMQALLLLIDTTGFYPLCRDCGHGKIFGLLATQCLLVYRYIGVLLRELQRMLRAYKARSYGNRSLPVRQWGAMTGQLLLRSIERSERIHRAMRARGFTGIFPSPPSRGIQVKEGIYLLGWVGTFLLLRSPLIEEIYTVYF